MPSWFKKVFQDDSNKPVAEQPEPEATPVQSAPSLDSPALGVPDTSAYESEDPDERKLVHAPIISNEEQQSSWSEDIQIKAQIQRDRVSCRFMVDRPVLESYSAWFPDAEWAEGASPLAIALFNIEGIGTVLLHGTTVALTLTYTNRRPWDEIAAEAGKVIRKHLKSDEETIVPEFVASMPSETAIREKLQECIDLEINPGIASHSGVITLERVEGNTVYITMGGGCQGCAASTITLKQGIHTSFRSRVPQVGAIYDETDHTAGTNPFYKELPAGMAQE